MEYQDPFIRLSCNLMEDYRMMKLNADMKCTGVGLYINMMLFLRNQKDYRHDLGDLDMLAREWGVTVPKILHLIRDFDLFEISKDGYFSCKYLNEVMALQQKNSKQPAGDDDKRGKTTRKTAVKPAAETAVKSSAETTQKAVLSASGNDEKSMKNEMKKNDEANDVKNSIQLVDYEVDNKCSQARVKQNSIREEKKREEKKIIEVIEIKKETDAATIIGFNLKLHYRFTGKHWDGMTHTVHSPLKIYIFPLQDYISCGCKIINLSPPSP